MRFLWFFMVFYGFLFSQNNDVFVDGVAAIIEDNIVLKSDLNQMLNMMSIQQKINPNKDFNKYLKLKELVLGSMVDQKILLELAEKDTTIEVSEKEVNQALDQQVDNILLQAGGKKEAEKIKKEIGTAIPTNTNTYAVKGRDLRSGTPKEVNITEEDTAEALNDILKEMVNGIKDALENTPPELSADLVDMGLTLTGGGALLKNIDKRFSKETGLPVHVADDPLACVAIGTGKALEQEETFSTMLSEY